MNDAPEIYKGLAGVPVDYTAISKVNPESNSLLYRGYPVQELAAQKSFEEVAWLLWKGELPTKDELAGFVKMERANRELSPSIKRVIDELPLTCHPMDVVRTAANLKKSMLLFAKLPAVVAYDQRRRRGQELIAPREDLDFSENFLWMTFGEIPDAVVVDAFRISLVLYAEHSFNASTFTARVITSTTSDLYSAVTGAIGALKGALHGGANEAVLHIFNEIGFGPDAEARAEAWLDKALAEKRKIMGFGHRVYKKGDSRVPTMRAAMLKLVEYYNRPDIAELYEGLEKAMTERKGILPNLDYPSGPAYHMMGFDTLTFTPLFVAARITGWTAHIMEQAAANALIRPLSVYNGVDERHL
jgi:citrate synthase